MKGYSEKKIFSIYIKQRGIKKLFHIYIEIFFPDLKAKKNHLYIYRKIHSIFSIFNIIFSVEIMVCRKGIFKIQERNFINAFRTVAKELLQKIILSGQPLTPPPLSGLTTTKKKIILCLPEVILQLFKSREISHQFFHRSRNNT